MPPMAVTDNMNIRAVGKKPWICSMALLTNHNANILRKE